MTRMLFVLFLFFVLDTNAQTKPFRFAFISDTHIGSPNGSSEEDLRRTVTDINSMEGIDFVVLTGDITELGTNEQLKRAKQILDSLKLPWYIIPGNHDTGWSESGGLEFNRVFGSDRFSFTHDGIRFIGCASGPYVRMSDGHVPRSAMNWMKKELAGLKKDEPVIFLNHYPLDNGLDNWYEVIDMLKTKNTVLALCGHGHANRAVNAEEIPAVMGRSNLRAKAAEGGYNLVDVRMDSFVFYERKPFTKTEKVWITVPNEKHSYDTSRKFPRPDFSVNEKYHDVKPLWTSQSSANVISTPVVTDGLVIFGNQDGVVEALDGKTGKSRWTFKTNGPVYSSPAAAKGQVVLGSSDGNIYCFQSAKGRLLWKTAAGAAVLGSPIISGDTVFIGSSAHSFDALDLKTGKIFWTFTSLEGPVVSKAVLDGERLIFGAWDRNLYALDRKNGQLIWKWDNGSPVINFSPAACIPVIHEAVVYVAAPDRYLSAIDSRTGLTLWRTNESTVRESIGISQKGDLVYGKTMQDTVVAFRTGSKKAEPAWKMNVGFGYEHAPSMLLERGGRVYFGTRNGVVYALDTATRTIAWAYKIDNSMVNTVNLAGPGQLIASTMDGKVVLLQEN